MGGNIHPSTIDGWIRYAMYCQGWWCWRRGRFEEAREWFRRSAEQARGIVERYGRATTAIFDLFAKLGDELAALCAAPRATPEERTAFLGRLGAAYREVAPSNADLDFLREELSRLKRASGGDEHEYNDEPVPVAIPFGTELEATLAPAPDVDHYGVPVEPPPHEDDEVVAQRFEFQVRKTGDCDLKVTVLTPRGDGKYGEAAVLEVRGVEWQTIGAVATRRGAVQLRVEALEPRAGAAARNPTYRFGWTGRGPAR
jgi:hypothetical protein